MKRYISPFLMLVLATWVMAPGWAQAGSGFYISSDIGLNVSQGAKLTGASNDGASACDEFLNPNTSGCPDVGTDFVEDWFTDFDGGQGILAGAAVGYSFAGQNSNSPLGGLRVELEYFYRESKHDETGDFGCTGGPMSTTCVKDANGEFGMQGVQERLNSITSHNLFANLYYDFANTSRFTPYIGIGGGVGVTEADWASNWTRTLDQGVLRDGYSYADYAGKFTNATMDQYNEYISNLAGSSSNTATTLRDTLWGLQILFGVDYAVTEAMSLGLKGRWVKFNSFSDNLSWNPLRSHAPYVRFDGTRDNPTGPMIQGSMSTSDIEFFGISVNMKYHF